MNVVANPNSVFPSQVVTNAEKDSSEYGKQVAQAIESEWFNQGGYGNRFATNFNHFHTQEENSQFKNIKTNLL